MSKQVSQAPHIDPALMDVLVERMSERLDQIIDELMAAYQAEIPSYAAAPQAFVEEVRGATTVSFMAGIAILRGDAVADDFHDPLLEIGRRRALQGIPLGEALIAWQISARKFWENICEIAPEDPIIRVDVIQLGATIIFDLLKFAVDALSAGYLEAEQERVADEEHDIQVVVEVLAGLREPDGFHKERASRRGIQLKELKWCAVALTSAEVIGSEARSVRRSLPGAAVGRIGEAVVVYSSGDKPPTIPLDHPMGVSPAENTQAAFRRARSAAMVASHLGQKEARYEEVVPLAMVLGAPEGERADFVAAQLGPLLADPLGDELVRSLRSYFGSGQSVAKAARELHVHRHTLEYRIERMNTLLGQDVREPGRRLLLELALALHLDAPG